MSRLWADAPRAASLPPAQAVLTIKDAIAAGSFYDNFLTGRKIETGDADGVFADPGGHGVRVFEGETACGGQEHFYLEPQCSYVIPGARSPPPLPPPAVPPLSARVSARLWGEPLRTAVLTPPPPLLIPPQF